MKRYFIAITLPEGNDEFWEGIGKRSGKKEVKEEVEQALAERGFTGCQVTVHDVVGWGDR